MPKATIKVYLHRDFILQFAKVRAWDLTTLAREALLDPKTLSSHLDEHDPEPATMKTLGKLSARLKVPPILLQRPELKCGDTDEIHFTFSGKVKGRANAEQVKQLLEALSLTANIEDDQFHYRGHHLSSIYIDVASTRRLAASILCKSRSLFYWVSREAAVRVYGKGGCKFAHFYGHPQVETRPAHVLGMIVPVKELAVPVTNDLGPNLGLGHIMYLLKARDPSMNRIKYLARHSLRITRPRGPIKERLEAVEV